MKFLILILYAHLFLSYTAGISEGFTDWLRSIANFNGGGKRRSKRGLYEFRDVITCLQPWVDILSTYSDYGCYCGFSGKGRPLDDTDKCCYLHDHCYDVAEKEEKTFSESVSGMYLTGYKFDCENESKITCRSDLNTPYQQHYCECDRLAAECFLYSRRTYNAKLFNIDSKRYCEKDSKSNLHELDLGVHTLSKLYSCEMKPQDDKCCLDKGYNSVYETCCGNIIRKIDADAVCCGSDYKPLNSTTSCCHDEYYDITLQSCCHGVIHDDVTFECKDDEHLRIKT